METNNEEGWTAVSRKKTAGIRIGSPTRINVQQTVDMPSDRATDFVGPNSYDVLMAPPGDETVSGGNTELQVVHGVAGQRTNDENNKGEAVI